MKLRSKVIRFYNSALFLIAISTSGCFHVSGGLTCVRCSAASPQPPLVISGQSQFNVISGGTQGATVSHYKVNASVGYVFSTPVQTASHYDVYGSVQASTSNSQGGL